MKASKFELPFVKKEKLNKDTYTFYFDRSDFSFNYLAGQYFRVTLKMDDSDQRGSSRYFTQSSSPTDKFLTITTRIIKSSFKKKLNSLMAGEKMTFFGPFGDVVQEEGDLTPKVFLAGGIGLTPAHSMLKFIDVKKLSVQFTLLVSFPSIKEVLFYEELKKIQKNNPGVTVVYFLTKQQKVPTGFEKGRITKDHIIKYAPGYKKSKVYITGPLQMAKSMEKITKDIGILEPRIVFEDFPGY